MSLVRAALVVGSLSVLASGCPTPSDTPDAARENVDAFVPDGVDAPMPSDTGSAPSGPRLVSLAAGENTSCAVLEDGTARCWGRGDAGQLGNGTTDSSVRPVEVSGLTDAIAISTGYEIACALRSGGTVMCWGGGFNGRLGNGAEDDSPVPVAVTGLDSVTQIRAGYSTVCALRDDGTVWCWGRGGELGDGGVSSSSVPQEVPGLTDVVQLAGASHGGTSLSSHTCGLRSDGTAFCWGLNGDGQNGTGNQDSTRSPAEVLSITDGTAIAVGMNHGCIAEGTGTFCFGASALIGDGSVERRFSPTMVTTSASFVELAAGFGHTCGRTSGGEVWCWGQNGSGQIGDGEPLVVSDQRLVPSQADVTGAVMIAAGASHTCAHTSSGVTYCWGRNEYGELGSGEPGSAMRSNVPMPVVW